MGVAINTMMANYLILYVILLPECKRARIINDSSPFFTIINSKHYIAASCTFCVSSITFSRKIESVSIKSFTVWQE